MEQQPSCYTIKPRFQQVKSHNIFFTRLTGLIKQVKNLKSDQQIQCSDIEEYITQETEVTAQIKKLESYKEENKHLFQAEKFDLYKLFTHMTGKNLITGLLLSLLANALNFLGIFILDEITLYLKDYKEESSQQLDISLMLIAIMINYFLKSIVQTQYQWQGNKWHAKCKTSIQYLVYQKSLRLKIYSNQNGSKLSDNNDSQDDTEKNPDINNILTVDVETLLQLYNGIIETISSIVSIVVIVLLIYYKIGSAIKNGLYILIGAFVFNMIVGLLVGIAVEVMYKIKDERAILTKDVIEGIKSIKYLSWEYIFLKKINSIRNREYKNLIFLKVLDGILTIFWQSLKVILLFTFLKGYLDQGNNLQDSNIFTIIALFGSLTYPLGIIPHTIEQVSQSRVSYNRIKLFLNQPEIEEETVQENVDESQQNVAIHLKQISFSWPSKNSNQSQTETQNFLQSSKNIKIYQSDQKTDDKISSKNEIKNYQFSLKIDNLVIQKGSLNYVVGEIGSGKTAFLLSILNEMDCHKSSKTNQQELINGQDQNLRLIKEESQIKKGQLDKGKIILNGMIGYVAQNHWLQSQTVRENILFGQLYDQEWYDICIKICQLKADFEQFDGGDLKLVSGDGSNLSGGQRQRISLCRALYQNKDIYLFDDIFSSLDIHVAHKIHQNIIEYLIKQYQKTVILVISHYGLLKHSIQDKNIIYINQGHLIQDQNIIQDYIQSCTQKIDKNQFNEEIFPQNLNQDPENEVDKQCELNCINLKKDKKNVKFLWIIFISILNKKQAYYQLYFHNQQVEQQIDENEEVREKGEIKLITWKAYIQSIGLAFVILFLLFEMLPSACSIFTDFWLRSQVSKDQNGSLSFHFIDKHFNSFESEFLFLTLLSICFATIGGILYITVSLLSSLRIFRKLNNSIMFSQMKFFDCNPIGRIMKRLSDDINIIDSELPMYIQIFLDEFSYTLGYPIAIIIQNPWLILFVLIAMVIAYFVQKVYREASREIKRLSAVDSGRLLTHITESSRGLMLIRSFKKERYMVLSYLQKLGKSINSFLLSEQLQVWMNIRLFTICCAVQSFIACSVIVIIVAKISIDYNIIALSLTYSILFINNFADCMLFFCISEQNFVSVERIRQYFDNTQENLESVKWNNHQTSQQNSSLNEQEVQEKNTIVFKSVSVSYDSQFFQNKNEIIQEESVHYALKNVSFSIKKGEKVAFCGRTGSGKTSILNVLFGMYPIQKGRIFVNNKDINDLTLKDLRSQMSIIPQFGFLYNASLRDNLDPLNSISQSRVQDLVQQSHLNLSKNQKIQTQSDSNQQDLQSKEQGDLKTISENDLSFQIEEGGKNLSNGQKQMINFLRIVLRDSEIICLDEATSNMDPNTDALLHQKLFEFSKEKTLIVITHRLENIEKFDRVFVLDQGIIVESGHASELKKIQGGFFYNQYQQEY
ncbi:ABC transporter C family protein (macronuclear) [Tetrahymena thermophila SB210]|uniref:ABC transporter C family protein n=1 Tax=Tetrahymena thermophila (strain SB210) TaxID=312017 RepID=I7LVH5_TETTS|nr:ABC transporter C family protein [Tetrahymena thermophila SB210]EAR98242.2 ABC transporter C family protein [Tetrahymena thermophila SB210]|eukprot:XP_001018487.2 ABC transporter C family protein [Tetrahymena thermophila SB210]